MGDYDSVNQNLLLPDFRSIERGTYSVIEGRNSNEAVMPCGHSGEESQPTPLHQRRSVRQQPSCCIVLSTSFLSIFQKTRKTKIGFGFEGFETGKGLGDRSKLQRQRRTKKYLRTSFADISDVRGEAIEGRR